LKNDYSIADIHSPPPKRSNRVDYFDFNDDVEEPEFEQNADEELERYMQSQSSTEEIISFWKTKAHLYPTLAMLARKVLGIPGSSSSPERWFSAMKLIVTDNRFNLSASMISKIMISKSLQ